MAEQKERRYIKTCGKLVEVSQDVYLTYYRMKRRENAVEEKDKQHGVVHYSDLDSDEMSAEEMLPAQETDLEEKILTKLMYEKLHRCLSLLPKQEQQLLRALFFDDVSERQLSEQTGIAQKTINERKRRALKRLRKLLEKP